MIRAEVHSDDRVFEVSFDATPFFEKASEEEILNLYRCGWGGDYPADEVARFFIDKNDEVNRLFDYLSRVRGVGFECHVDSITAKEWLKKNRPRIFIRLYEGEGNTYIRFDHIPEDRSSEPLGPFPFVQLTHELIRIGPDGEEIGHIDEDDMWVVIGDPNKYTDVVIYGEEEKE